MTFIIIISIFAIILNFSLFSFAPAPQLAANLNKAPCGDKHCWYWVVAADTYSFDFQLTFTFKFQPLLTLQNPFKFGTLATATRSGPERQLIQ